MIIRLQIDDDLPEIHLIEDKKELVGFIDYIEKKYLKEL